MGDFLDALIGALLRCAVPSRILVTRRAGHPVGPPDGRGIKYDVALGAVVDRGVPNPEIRCSDRHLATAEDISLGLSFCVRQVVIRDLESSVRLVRELLPWKSTASLRTRSEHPA
jgi:hypothetical protein